jgi:hypothetical protein
MKKDMKENRKRERRKIIEKATGETIPAQARNHPRTS